MPASICDLPDEMLECIFLNLPTWSDRSLQVETVCKRWRQISLSLWQRIVVVDIARFRSFSPHFLADDGFLRHAYWKSVATLEINKDRVDFTRIQKLEFKQDVYIHQGMLSELLARCPDLVEIILEDIYTMTRNDTGQICIRYDDFNIPDAPRLQTLSMPQRHLHLPSPLSASHALSTLIISVTTDNFNLLRQILQNCSNTLQAVHLDFYLCELIDFNDAFFADSFPNLKWLCIKSFPLNLASYFKVMLDNLPYLQFLYLKLYNFSANVDIWKALAHSKQILQLKLLDIVISTDFVVKEQLIDFLTDLFCSRRFRTFNLEPLRFVLTFWQLYIQISNVEDVKSKISYIKNAMADKFERANVVECLKEKDETSTSVSAIRLDLS